MRALTDIDLSFLHDYEGNNSYDPIPWIFDITSTIG